MGNASGQIGAVGFFQRRFVDDKVFGLVRRKLRLLGAGVENNDADDKGEYVAEFCHNRMFPVCRQESAENLKIFYISFKIIQ